MYRHISEWHTFDFVTMSSLMETRWLRWCSGGTWHRFWFWLSVSVWWRCTCSFAHPPCLCIVCCAILAMKSGICFILMTQRPVSFYHSLYLSMPRKVNTPLPLFSDFCTRFVDQILCFLNCGPRKPSFCHFGPIKGKAQVRMF